VTSNGKIVYRLASSYFREFDVRDKINLAIKIRARRVLNHTATANVIKNKS